LGLFFVLAIGGVSCAVFVHYRHYSQHERLVNESMEDEDQTFSNAQQYSDQVYDEDYDVDSDEEQNENQDGDLELRPID
jgi:hypothetical protein